MNASKPVSYVLVADDDKDDTEMLTTAMSAIDKNLEIVVVDNGKQVLEHLKTLTDAANSSAHPCVLVMDMNMPKMDGRETVVAVKSNTDFKDLPIFLYSTSKNKTDELFAEKWGVHYFQKPDTLKGLDDVAKIILEMCFAK